MQNKLRMAIILFVIPSVLIGFSSCSKKTPATRKTEVTMPEEDLEAQKVREQLEKERQKLEAKARQLRAQKIKFMNEDVYFEKGSYKLGLEARELLKSKALWLQKNSDLKVIIEGHTDEAGSKEYNFALGDQRAGAVKSFLIGQDVQPWRLIAVSYGNERPIDTGNSETVKSRNRRVHFVLEE